LLGDEHKRNSRSAQRSQEGWLQALQIIDCRRWIGNNYKNLHSSLGKSKDPTPDSGSSNSAAQSLKDACFKALTSQAMRGEAVMKYSGTWGTLSTISAEEGFAGLWKGNFANVLRVVPVYALKFSFNDTFKVMVGGNAAGQLNFSQLLLSGTMAVSDLSGKAS
jgi:hypothetical protein